MEYLQILPNMYLRQYVRCFGVLYCDEQDSLKRVFKIFADGCPGLIFQEKEEAFLDTNYKPLPQLYIHGLTTKQSENFSNGSFYNIIVHFKPNALKCIFGIDANELTDKLIPLNDYIKNNLAEKLLETNKLENKIELLSIFLLRLIVKNQNNNNLKTDFLIAKMKEPSDDFTLENIYTTLNISERSLERLFKTDIGVSPKLFLRIVRFQFALHQLRHNSSTSLTKLAYDFNYCDQSHYNREFKEFAGSTPRQFIQNANELVVNFPEWKL